MFPLSLSTPKELLPILELPAIHWTALEARASGIERFVIVISKGKEQVGDYFRPHSEIEEKLRNGGKSDLLDVVTAPQKLFSEVVSVYQDEPLGLGHAVLCARDVVGNEPFAVMLPDDLFLCEPPCLTQLAKALPEKGGCIAVSEVAESEFCRYGMCGGKEIEDGVIRVERIVEKPPAAKSPGRVGTMGRYLLPPEVFDYLAKTKPGAIGEIQLTDALQRVAEESELLAVVFKGERFDAGTLEGYIETQLKLAARDGKYRGILKTLLSR